MNPSILKSLALLHQFQNVKVLEYQLPDGKELRAIYESKSNQFYCFNDKTFTDFLPEEIAILDTEWLCANEGAVYLTEELPAVTIRKPFSCQFIGLSGKSYLWFQPGDYADPKSLIFCSVGSLASTFIVHKIAADRPMIAESFNRNTNEGPNFFCTMSAHLLCAGVSSQQSWQYQMGSDKPRVGGLKNLVDTYNFWSQTSFPDVLHLSAKRGTLTPECKEIREMFYKGTLQGVLAMLPELVSYGMGDVEKVAAIYKSLFPAWLDALPAKESQYFYLKRAKVNYSLSENFNAWFFATEEKYQEIKSTITSLIASNNAAKLLNFKQEIDAAIDKNINDLAVVPDSFCLKNKPGVLQKKWTVETGKPYLLAQELLADVKQVIADWQKRYNGGSWALTADGTPKWAKSDDSSADSPQSQLLLDAQYKYSIDREPSPVLYDKKEKFVYSNGIAQIKITSPKKGVNTKDNCGSILSKDFMLLWETRVLATEGPEAKQIVGLMGQISYWTSVRSRQAEIVVLQAGGKCAASLL